MDKNKIDGYFERMIDAMKFGNFSEARNFTMSILGQDPWNHIAIIFKNFIEGSLKKPNGRYKSQLDQISMGELILQMIDYDAQNKCPQIFEYYKKLMENIDYSPTQSILDECEYVIENLNDNSNEQIVNFLSFYNKFYKKVKNSYHLMRKEYNAEMKEFKNNCEYLEDLDKRIKKTKIINKILGIIIAVLLLIAITKK